mmetsp:Transcript_26943/g.41316  ORF Transcript_26943/g.41316 Transcript_26943/m.41316 type:complete len:177 (+) Transcript_26943:1-531(+)|eukprot:CAMPEP_0118673646 /NCGR_PEP_ID=MMETSP0800-20121206/443_1 /TAXON_ID=210618 ORGANISM="Striatella unipunctata, Strain CCMP2910" /NCGR_SAMPLE_ID=MMETSP0800 /ASSEMBLY_ACC=CAM_ASM_000638 /LENGTH=176 /DNA_ID=CAMNT_0006568743 /DNA_START=355 /DNA_END=885 /DNA_ORIENTATION=+
MYGTGAMLTRPTLMEVKPMRFLIMDAPLQSNLHLYIKECRKHHVTDVVRVCEPTYSSNELANAGIKLHEMPYEDGHSPPNDLIEAWLEMVDRRFFQHTADQNDVTIAIHCVAGLGRGPAMVALALIEFANMNPFEAVTLIRRHRRGAINEKQMSYLERYKKRYKRHVVETACCTIM